MQRTDRDAVLEAIVTDICELPGDDDPEADDTLILSLDDLRVILERNLSTPEPVPDAVGKLVEAWRDVLAERQRQIRDEGWSTAHDDEHDDGSLAAAAAAYAFSAATVDRYLALDAIGFWPWAPEYWKPSTPRRDLIKAGALVLAEIERLDRAALQHIGERA